MSGPSDPPGPGPVAPPGRRELAYSMMACLAGGGLAALAAGRAWDGPRTGGDLLPWLPALALVGLAGAGALVATRGPARAALGALLAACGLGVAGGAGYAAAGGAPAGWPAVTALAGLALAAGGILAALRGRRWPALGGRYDRRPARAAPTSLDAWAALDRGEDPTVDGPDGRTDGPPARPAG